MKTLGLDCIRKDTSDGFSPSVCAVRFDAPGGKLRQPHRTPDGFLYADAIFARDGVLEYYQADGTVRKELRLPEENAAKHTLYAAVPLTLEHPPALLTPDTAQQYTKGFTLSETAYDTKGGFVRGAIMAYDSALIEGIEKGDSLETSAGYTCIPAYLCKRRNEPGVWRGEKYDSIQELASVNHVCTTRAGRAGKTVRVLMDSLSHQWDMAYQIDLASSDSNYEPSTKYFDLGGNNRVSTTANTVPVEIGKVTYNLDSAIAPVVSDRLEKLDALAAEKQEWEQQRQEITEKLDSLQEKFNSLTTEKERLEGRCDHYEEVCDSSLALLEQEGYRYDADKGEFYFDGEDSEENYMDTKEEDEDEEDYLDMKYKKDMKHKKKEEEEDYLDMDDMEEEEEKKDSISDVLVAIKEAETVCSSFKYESHMDSVVEVQKGVIAAIYPDLKLDDKSVDWIAGRYEGIKEMTTKAIDTRTDSSVDYTRELSEIVKRADNRQQTSDLPESELARMDNINKPLMMSKDS